MNKNLELILEIRDEIIPICNAAITGLNSKNPDFILPNLSDAEVSILDQAANVLNQINSMLAD